MSLRDAAHHALADMQDWNELEALRESLREHMAEVHRLRLVCRQALAELEKEARSADDWLIMMQAARTALRSALAEDAMQRLTDVQQELDCYGDGNVYRGQRSSDSQTPTLTIKDNLTVEPVAFIHSGCARRMREVLTQADFNGDKSEFLKYCMTDRNWLPLYPAPPKREPLTDEEIQKCVGEVGE